MCYFLFTLTMPVFTQEYKGVLENFQESLMKCFFLGGGGVVLAIDWHPIQGEVLLTLVTLCYGHRLFYLLI